MNTRLNIKKLDGKIVQKLGGSKQVGLKQLGSKQVGFKQLGVKQVGFKQLGPGVETGVHRVQDEKRVWFKDKQPEEKTNTDCLVKEQKKEYQIGWKIKSGNVLDSCNQRSTQQCMKSEVVKHLGVARIQQQNGLVYETNVTLFAKVRYFLIQSGLPKVFWAEDTTSIKQGMLKPVKVKCIFLRNHKSIVGNKLWRLDDVTSKVVLYRNIGFNESGEYKKTFIGFGVGTGSVPVLQGVEFEVEPQEDHTFEVEPHRNVDHVVGSQKVQTRDLIYYHSARDMEQHSAWELFSYREDSNEVAFAVAAVEKIYAHEDQSGNTLRVSQSRIHNEKLVLTLLEEHSILSLKDSLLGDCDVEKNGSLKANLQHMEALSTTEAGYMTFTEA
ncbi:hypothetical protein Tco_0681639 [Tanacetum coccineum]|uniref:Uncharacterized protein n=1 Tax=Tanacetum coccineum TaxID=301880 RepID=A0ABQ4XQI4_9ASTR